MSSRLLSVGLLVVSMAIGFGVGRALGPDEAIEAPGSTIPTDDTSSAAQPNLPVSPGSTGPTLSELVPGITDPIFLETTNPTQLLRWDPDEPAPLPVRNIPAGHDLEMDRDARYVLVAIADEQGDLLLGGLAGSPLTLLGRDVGERPARSDFTDHFWFAQGGEFVEMNTRGEERMRVPIPDMTIVAEGVDPTLFGSPTIALADEAGLVIEQWYAIADGPPMVRRVLLQQGTLIELPGGTNSFAVGMDETVVFLRSREGALTTVDRATGTTTSRDYDGTCGLTLTAPDGTMASVCRGMASVFLTEAVHEVGTWTSGRWSSSGKWFMAVGGYFGELLLIDGASGEVNVVRFSLTPQTLVTDIWSGA